MGGLLPNLEREHFSFFEADIEHQSLLLCPFCRARRYFCSRSVAELSISAMKKHKTEQCRLCDLCVPGPLSCPWQKAKQAPSSVENSVRHCVKVKKIVKKGSFSLFLIPAEQNSLGNMLSLNLPTSYQPLGNL